MRFDRLGARVEAPAQAPAFATGELSLMAWVQLDLVDSGPPSSIQIIGDSGNGVSSHRLRLVEGAPQLELSANPEWLNVAQSVTKLTAGEWHHVAATYGPNGGKVYIDAVLAGQGKTLSPLNDAYNIRMIGCSLYPTVTDQLFGNVDEVRVYNVELSAQAIQALYAADR